MEIIEEEPRSDDDLVQIAFVEDPLAEEVPEPANVTYLADATGDRPRDYSVLGAYGAWTVAIAILAVAFVILLMLK